MSSKDGNPKDAIGTRKWRQFFTIPQRVMWEVGVALLEGAMKYGRHNYRPAGVRASVYTDAAMGHISQWIEGEDIDSDSGLSHITKAIASLVVLRDGMIEGNFEDDRPPRHEGLDAHRGGLQAVVEGLFEKYPEPVRPFTQKDADISSEIISSYFDGQDLRQALQEQDALRAPAEEQRPAPSLLDLKVPPHMQFYLDQVSENDRHQSV